MIAQLQQCLLFIIMLLQCLLVGLHGLGRQKDIIQVDEDVWDVLKDMFQQLLPRRRA